MSWPRCCNSIPNASFGCRSPSEPRVESTILAITNLVVRLLHFLRFGFGTDKAPLCLIANAHKKAARGEYNGDENTVLIFHPQQIGGDCQHYRRNNLESPYHALTRLACDLCTALASAKRPDGSHHSFDSAKTF